MPERPVGDILRRARMSRRTFYQLFRNREECFLATYDAALAEAMERLAVARDGEGRRWHGQVEAALAALFEYLAAEPGWRGSGWSRRRRWVRRGSSATSAP